MQVRKVIGSPPNGVGLSKLIRQVVGVAAVGCLMSSVAAYADDDNKKGIEARADLSSAQSVPAPGPGFIESARATAKFDRDLSSVRVKLRVQGGSSVGAAHFHCARPGSIGPVAFGLFVPGPLIFDGSKAKGTLTNADFTGADCIGPIGRPVSNIAGLALAMRDGLIYINVHTLDNLPGEVRGQMLTK